MEIPEYFVEKATRTYGSDAWVKGLPEVVEQCAEKWRLSDCAPVDSLSINLVCFARSPLHGDVVLKIDGPHDERFTEIAALRLYAGRNACRCFDVDEEKSALLLERLRPGCDLRTLEDRTLQVEIAAELIAALPIAVEGEHIFPHYADWVSRAFSLTRAQYAPSQRMQSLIDSAETLFAEVDRRDHPRLLLHGDLHHENILQGADGTWKAIDPQGAIGLPFFESARFIQNHVVDAESDHIDIEELDETVSLFASRLGESRRVIAVSLFVLDVLSTCWGYEMNYSPERIARGERVSAQIHLYVEQI